MHEVIAASPLEDFLPGGGNIDYEKKGNDCSHDHRGVMGGGGGDTYDTTGCSKLRRKGVVQYWYLWHSTGATCIPVLLGAHAARRLSDG